jgi:hypothetical protein
MRKLLLAAAAVVALMGDASAATPAPQSADGFSIFSLIRLVMSRPVVRYHYVRSHRVARSVSRTPRSVNNTPRVNNTPKIARTNDDAPKVLRVEPKS